jgi:histone H3/H4
LLIWRVLALLAEIFHYQEGAEADVFQILPTPFARVVKEIGNRAAAEFGRTSVRFKKQAVHMLQEYSEIFLSFLFLQAYRNAVHAKRKTLKAEDIQEALCQRFLLNKYFVAKGEPNVAFRDYNVEEMFAEMDEHEDILLEKARIGEPVQNDYGDWVDATELIDSKAYINYLRSRPIFQKVAQEAAPVTCGMKRRKRKARGQQGEEQQGRGQENGGHEEEGHEGGGQEVQEPDGEGDGQEAA